MNEHTQNENGRTRDCFSGVRLPDLRTLARWFAETDTDSDAHRLWMAAFGLAPSRHMSVDSESLTERETKPIRPQTSWLDASSVKITPRLRSTGRYTRKGPGTALIDRSAPGIPGPPAPEKQTPREEGTI